MTATGSITVPARPERPVRRLRRTGATAITALGAVVVHLAAQAGVAFAQPGWSWTSFRRYFETDQLAYLGIAANAAAGDPGGTEPFTRTGTSFYPSLHYVVVGLVARAVGVSPAAAWQIVGLGVQVLLVAVLALVLVRFGGRARLGLLAPLPFVLGTFSFVAAGTWFTWIDSHAVLWGAFGVLYTLNAESAALSIGAIALLGLLVVHGRPAPAWARIGVTIGAVAAIGLLANVHTYTFIAIVHVAAYGAAAWAVAVRPTRRLVAASLAGVGAVYVLGPVVAGGAGQLPALVVGLLPAVPGLLRIAGRAKAVTAVAATALLATAAPTIGATLAGIARQDPFLTYRVASNVDLGVTPWQGALGAIVPVSALALVAVIGARLGRPMLVGVPIGLVAVWVVVSSNDVWGANAEPYRMWIAVFLISSVLALVLLVDAVRGAARSIAEGPAADAPRDGRRLSMTMAALAMLALVSATDWALFLGDAQYHEVRSLSGPTEAVQAEAVRSAPTDGLVAVDPCVDPVIVKANTGARIAHYHLGMAWPAERDAVEALRTARRHGDLDLAAAATAGVEYVVTDDSCAADWLSRYPMAPLTTVARDGASATLWRLEPAPVSP